MSEENLREHRRVHVVWRAVFRPKGSTHNIRGKTSDLSMGGVAAYFESQLQVGQLGTLYLEVVKHGVLNKQFLEIECAVVYSTLVGHINAFRTGIKFKAINPEFVTILNKLM